MCPRCKKRVRPLTTVGAWDHITKKHREWMRELFALDDGEIKRELLSKFSGIVG